MRSLICNFGLAHLPRSMARVWELVLNCAIAILYLWFCTVSRYGAMPNELLILVYVLNIGYILAICIFVAHSVLNWFVTTFTTSLTRVTHVVKPMECNLVSSSYTFFTIVLAGIWCRRLIKLNTDMVHWTLGGNIPHSPCTMMLLVVALTFSMRLQYLNMTLSIDSKPALRCPQTSLPNTNMGFITESNNLNITFGGSGALSRILCIIPNMAFRPWSHR